MRRSNNYKNSTSQPQQSSSSFFPTSVRERSQSSPMTVPISDDYNSDDDTDMKSFFANPFVKSSSSLTNLRKPLPSTQESHTRASRSTNIRIHKEQEFLTLEDFFQENKPSKHLTALFDLKDTLVPPFHSYALLTKTQMSKALIMESRKMLKDAFELFEAAINYVFSKLRITANVIDDEEKKSLIHYFSQTINKESGEWNLSQFSFENLPDFLRRHTVKEHFNEQISRATEVYEKYKKALEKATHKSASALFHDAIPEEVAEHYYRMDDLLTSLFKEVQYNPRELFLEQQHLSKQLADKIKEGVTQWQEEEPKSPPKTLHLSGSFTSSSPRGEGFFYLSRAWGDSLKKHLREQWTDKKEPLKMDALDVAVANWFSQLKEENPSAQRTPSQRRHRYLNGM